MPGSDGAGEVLATGPDSAWKPGDRVVLAPNAWRRGSDQPGFDTIRIIGGAAIDGTLRELAVATDDSLIRAPANLSFEEACCLPTAGNSAMRALFGEEATVGFKTKPGDWVLAQGTGAVSLWTIQVGFCPNALPSA